MAKSKRGRNPGLAKSIIYLARSPTTARARKERKWVRDPARHEHYSCKGKKSYISLAEADAKAVELNAAGDGWHEQQGYKCWYCPNWHVGRMLKLPALHLEIAKDRLLLENFYGFNSREIGCLQQENVKGKHRLEGIRQRGRAALKRANRSHTQQ